MSNAAIMLARMTHDSYRTGRASIMDADLARFLDIYGEDLRPLLEEVQFLRTENERLAEALAIEQDW